MLVAQHCERAKCHRIAHCKTVNFMLYKFYPNKIFFKRERGRDIYRHRETETEIGKDRETERDGGTEGNRCTETDTEKVAGRQRRRSRQKTETQGDPSPAVRSRELQTSMLGVGRGPVFLDSVPTQDALPDPAENDPRKGSLPRLGSQ